VRASLADQAGDQLAIALGANLPSPVGEPADTLVAVRRILEQELPGRLLALVPALTHRPQLQWAPLYCTEPMGGPAGQPAYLNSALVVGSLPGVDVAVALELLDWLQALEQRFGRQRREHWGPRSLDLDLLWWGDVQSLASPRLQLPHPRLQERSFVLAPLAAIDPQIRPPGAAGSVAALLEQLAAAQAPPLPLAPRPGWPEFTRSGPPPAEPRCA
jgi:2-amino-4-hydroxy-6-hydroxymethyldihydropteridine diphosphokinase